MFTALLLNQENKQTVATFERMERTQLPPGDVTVRVEYSSLNFKDALAVTGRGAIVRKWPLVPGIDLAGVVEIACSSPTTAAPRRGYCSPSMCDPICSTA